MIDINIITNIRDIYERVEKMNQNVIKLNKDANSNVADIDEFCVFLLYLVKFWLIIILMTSFIFIFCAYYVLISVACNYFVKQLSMLHKFTQMDFQICEKGHKSKRKQIEEAKNQTEWNRIIIRRRRRDKKRKKRKEKKRKKKPRKETLWRRNRKFSQLEMECQPG